MSARSRQERESIGCFRKELAWTWHPRRVASRPPSWVVHMARVRAAVSGVSDDGLLSPDLLLRCLLAGAVREVSVRLIYAVLV